MEGSNVRCGSQETAEWCTFTAADLKSMIMLSCLFTASKKDRKKEKEKKKEAKKERVKEKEGRRRYEVFSSLKYKLCTPGSAAKHWIDQLSHSDHKLHP